VDLLPALLVTAVALVFTTFTALTFSDLKNAVADNEPDNFWVNLFLGALSAIAGALVSALVGAILFAGYLIVNAIVEQTSGDIDWSLVGCAVVGALLAGFILSSRK
jgi:hypothetical protein